MPLRDDEIHVELERSPADDGRWHWWTRISIAADALRRLGLHPDQPSATVTGRTPPTWWHHDAERSAHRRHDGDPRKDHVEPGQS